MVRFFVMSGATGIGRVLNISSTGAFLATTARLRPLSLVYLEPAAAAFWETQSRRIAASVVRQDTGGVGIEWCEASAQTTRLVTSLTSLTSGSAGEERRPAEQHSRLLPATLGAGKASAGLVAFVPKPK
jgi:hypothetical protein